MNVKTKECLNEFFLVQAVALTILIVSPLLVLLVCLFVMGAFVVYGIELLQTMGTEEIILGEEYD